MRAVDLFAGPGGWSQALKALGIPEVGLELDRDACATRAAAGHATIRTDVARYPAERFAGWELLIASPPCQDFSAAGKRAGRTGRRGALVDTVPDWVESVRPQWILCEQVPPVLPIWREHANHYTRLGYSVWTGVLNAADYGVPQTRERAVLLATWTGAALPPDPTHGKVPRGVQPWVSQAAALGWPDGDSVLVGFPRRDDRGDSPDGYRTRDWRRGDLPAFVLTEKARSWQVRAGDDSRPLDVTEAARLQTFPPDYPLAGSRSSRFLQVGNAVPPVLAQALIEAVIL